jgi:hypothetical protein
VAVGRKHLGLNGEGKRWWVPMKVAFFVCCCSAAEMKGRRVDKWITSNMYYLGGTGRPPGIFSPDPPPLYGDTCPFPWSTPSSPSSF